MMTEADDDLNEGRGSAPILVGVAFLAAAFFVALSLASSDTHDPRLPTRLGAFGLNVPFLPGGFWGLPDYPLNGGVRNMGGIVGASLAGHLHAVWGLAAWLLVLVLVVWGTGLCVARTMKGHWWRVVGALLCLLATSTLLSALTPSVPFLSGVAEKLVLPTPQASAGGLFGFFCTDGLGRVFGSAGTFILLAVAYFTVLVLVSETAAETLLAALGRGAVRIGRRLARTLRRAAVAEPPATAAAGPRIRVAAGQPEAEAEKAPAPAPPPEPEAESAADVSAARLARARAKAEARAERGGKKRGSAAASRAAEKPPPPPPAKEAAPARERSGAYHLPPLELLEAIEERSEITGELLTKRGNVLVATLHEFKIETQLVSIERGPAVTLFELELAPGIRVHRVFELQDNIAMAMKSPNVRVIAPIPGRSTIGIEVPNAEREIVRLRPVLESGEFRRRAKEMAIPLGLGRDVHGTPLVEDLAQMPHLLIAGATGSGKSVCLNSIITTILMLKSPDDVKLLLVDPKMIEMTQYKRVPHLISPVVTDMKRAAGVLEWAVRKMDERYRMISAVGVRDVARFNRLSIDERLGRVPPDEETDLFREHMPYIVIVVDELADLMMVASKEIETSITRLAHKARAIGIHIVFATQRPSVDVITGLIKANLPARLAFQVASKVDSRTILDQNGAEKLTGRGDFLFLPPTTSTLIRARGVYVSDEEIATVANHVTKESKPEFLDELEAAARGSAEAGKEGGHQDELYEIAVRVVLTSRRASVSLLQRKLAIGYTRAAKLIDMMADRGLIGPYRGAKPREIYTSLKAWEGGADAGEAEEPEEADEETEETEDPSAPEDERDET